ncbi:PWWP domain-containing protein 1-like isoform X2 [Phragmites australis]|uniref:PWWP domain-containing protein 1-like isoform X2 n=1 Tax=Phragmites australis TaxID=29695 RepID=UPI002D767027|nr:PWWP domain-containing protein 1-like isoform X2 [Phragmites australis]
MPSLPSPSQTQIPKTPRPPEPWPKPKPGPLGPPSKSRVSIPLHRMSDPTAAGTMVPAGDGGSWANGGPRFGDMVWGKVKSHPWWPGHIYSITLTDEEEIHRGHSDGLILVAFFGDSSYGWFDPHELVPFEDHFAEKAAQGGSTRSSFAAAVAEAVDEVARRGALALLCPCRNPDAFRPHPSDARFLLVDVPGFDSDADYHPDQISSVRERFVPRKALDYLLEAAVTQRDAAEAAARTVLGIEMAGLFAACRRARFAERDTTYAEAFGVDPEKALAAEKKAAAERAQRARPLQGDRKTPEQVMAGRRRGGPGGAAARLMEKIMPGASAMKAKVSKKDQYLLKRRDPPEPSHRPAPLPDAPPALDDGPPSFGGGDPPTPPLPGSAGVHEEEFMLQRRAPLVEIPPAAHPSEGAAAAVGTDAAPKKATKPKKPRKREREEAADAGPAAHPSEGAAAAVGTDAAPKKVTKPKKPRKSEREEAADAGPAAAGAVGEPKKKKKKKKLSNLDGGAVPTATAAAAGSGKPAASPPPKLVVDLNELNLKQSYENDPPEESKMSLDKPSAAADGQPPKKKKPAARPGAVGDPTKAGVKRGPSDRQEELAVKKKAKLDKIKTLSNEKKAGGLDLKDAPAASPAAQQQRPAAKEKVETAAKKKEPAPAPRIKTPSPTTLMMKFPVQSTLPSVASLKARFARFGPLDVDGIRVYWKSHMCRVVYRFRSDAEAALKYARRNAMFGQVDPHYQLREAESSSGEPPAPDAPPRRSDLRLMETAPFRPGSSGNGAPLPMSRAVPTRVAVGQQPKSILKKSSDEGAAGTMREVPRVKFMLDGGDSKLEPPALLTSGGGGNGTDNATPVGKSAKSVGFTTQLPARALQPPMRPTQQQLQPRVSVTQPLPPPPPPYQPRISDGQLSFPGQPQQPPYPPRHTDGLPPFSSQPSQPPPRHSDSPLQLPGQPPLPYQPRSTGFTGHQQQQPYPPRSRDSSPFLPGQPQQQLPPRPSFADDVPAWKRSEKEFKEELMRVMTGIAKMVEPLTDKNGFFPYHLFRRA